MVFGLFRKSKNDNLAPSPVELEPTEGQGRLTVDDIFLIKGRGVIVTGQVESGSFRVGQKITIQTTNGPIVTTITGIDAFHKQLNFANVGTFVGLAIGNLDRDTISRGNLITTEE